MSGFSRCFLAVSRLTGLFKIIQLERSVYQLDPVCHLSCLYQGPHLRLKHTDQGKKHRTKKSSERKLPQAKVPQELRSVSDDRKQLLQLTPVLGEDLTLVNYKEKFTTLLHLEEIQQELNLRYFGMKNVKFRYDGKYFYLYVPAIAAGDLVVTPDNQIVVTHATNTDMPQQLATVYKESNGCLQLVFKEKFSEHYDQDLPEWNIRFIYNRVSLRRCHRAVQMFRTLGTKVLFPDKLSLQPPCSVMGSDLDFFDLYLDEQQRMAVKQIIAGESRPVPYILFGPPGTGKTVTMVEAILQIYTNIPGCRILVCAPSNSAVNLLALKLHESGRVNPGRMARHFAVQRLQDEESIPESVRPYSRVISNIGLAFKYCIVLTTCNSAGALSLLGLNAGHYTHVFIDEAGQGIEPETLIPATLVSHTDGQIILSGDPHQLGPVVFSSAGKEFGLDISLLQRLMQLPLYSRNTEKFSKYGSYNPLLTSSKMFYHDEIQAEGATPTTHRLCTWQELPVQGIPVIFHSIQGTEQIGFYKPSRFNIEEATVVVEYIKKMFDTIPDLKEEHIGIITPYSLQVETIQEMIGSQLYKKIDVGTVEYFQGQERRIIIISTVRSREETDASNLRVLGFLRDQRRLNVSLTRAQALLIVIGNPRILNRNQFWKAFIDYCKCLGVYIHHKTLCDFRALEMDK